MPLIDSFVIGGIVVAMPVLLAGLRRRGVRGWRFARHAWLLFTGVVVATSMAAHNLDVLGRLSAGAGHDGTPWSYDFRVYSLLLLGTLLAAAGARIVAAVVGAPCDHDAATRAARRASAVVLIVAAPLTPVHAVFALPLTVMASLNLLVLLPAGFTQAQVSPERAERCGTWYRTAPRSARRCSRRSR